MTIPADMKAMAVVVVRDGQLPAGAAAHDPASLGQVHHSGLGLQHLDALGIPVGIACNGQ